MTKQTVFLTLLVLLSTVIVAHMPHRAQPNIIQPTDRPFSPVDLPTWTPTPTTTPATPACLPLDPARPDAEHRVTADVDYVNKALTVQQRTRYANRSGTALERIVFNVEPNRWPNVFTLREVQVDDVTVEPVLEGKRLTVPLAQPLPADCNVTITLDFMLTLPRVGVEVYSYKGFLGYTDRQMNLGHWLPSVAVRDGTDWITRSASLIGEQEVLDKADWQVTLNLMSSPENITIAAPGVGGALTERTWRYTYLSARDFSISISDQFRLATTQLDNGVRVEAYTFDVPGSQAAADHFLMVAAESLAYYADLFGSFTDERMLVVQGDFPDGMEHSGLVFVGDAWFTRWDGSPASYLTLITVHEVAHQWWYARVGNDPALTPWLDEALSTYSELIYIEEFYPDLVDWWWRFRVEGYYPQGFVDGTVYEFSSIREYINAVYLRGVLMLRDLRTDLGDRAFFALLREYAAIGAGSIASSDDFWALLTPEQLALTQATRDRYFRAP
jgi:hypothetical protein